MNILWTHSEIISWIVCISLFCLAMSPNITYVMHTEAVISLIQLKYLYLIIDTIDGRVPVKQHRLHRPRPEVNVTWHMTTATQWKWRLLHYPVSLIAYDGTRKATDLLKILWCKYTQVHIFVSHLTAANYVWYQYTLWSYHTITKSYLGFFSNFALLFEALTPTPEPND